ncbi:SIMPL domain-containing protein [Ramlibacter rhizophilus]|uniref:DUF541 domain-containing protein n=1 Tax=Ramlibacter rhizophilus TaxID=1781167 RepID=A0A4Z0BC47_9BURK|nr:SIMPL domain-containing protein [Ramlibacter rhizophilus]TFY96806.1 DUF541 domain-containing protein [Ramlibacter rhizophilus]
MSQLIRVLGVLSLALCLLPATARAQGTTAADAPPRNVLHLNASAGVEVVHDHVQLTLSTTREAPTPGPVQEQLRAAVDQALATLRPQAEEGQMEVRSGGFQVQPRYGREGRIQSWAGTAQLILEGRDIQRISRAAGRVETMTVAGLDFGLSRERRQEAEGRAQQQAIARFRAQAGELARGFGFGGYELREVTVQSADPGPFPRPRMMAMEVRSAAADAAVPVEPGRSTVTVTVSGSVQMQPSAASR